MESPIKPADWRTIWSLLEFISNTSITPKVLSVPELSHLLGPQEPHPQFPLNSMLFVFGVNRAKQGHPLSVPLQETLLHREKTPWLWLEAPPPGRPSLFTPDAIKHLASPRLKLLLEVSMGSRQLQHRVDSGFIPGRDSTKESLLRSWQGLHKGISPALPPAPTYRRIWLRSWQGLH